MGSETQPTQMAAFLRDITEATTRQQRTVDDQTRKGGFVQWCDEALAIDGVRAPYLEDPGVSSTTYLIVPRPAQEPQRPMRPEPRALHRDDIRVYEAAENRWKQWNSHKNLYDQLFAARTPPDAMELVVANGLLTATGEQGELRRHLAVSPAEVLLDRNSGTLTVEATDAPSEEVNWTTGDIRSVLSDQAAGLKRLVEAESHADAEIAVKTLVASFGTKGIELQSPSSRVAAPSIGLGVHAAVLLRQRDASSLLELLRVMAEDMAAGGFVSEPFKMVTSPSFRPAPRSCRHDRAALPLPANVEQRSMIDRARAEAHMVIQGPPGTGKTHTIANLAAVLMAEGRRVLITAENDRALTEVQSKLPTSMQPLMLPLLRERGTAALQASVNALTTRASGGRSAAERSREIDERLSRLTDIEERVLTAERRLQSVAAADVAPRTFGSITMPLAGHQMALAGEKENLTLIETLLGSTGRATAADANTLLDLSCVVDAAHIRLRDYPLPDDLMEPGDLAVWLRDLGGQLAVLGDPTGYDHSALTDRVDDLARLSNLLQEVPPTPWSAINRTTEEYLVAAEECMALAPAVDHSVTVEPPNGRASAITLLEAYLGLDGERFDQPLEELLQQHDRARVHASAAGSGGAFTAHRRAAELAQAAERALDLLRRDQSGLLADYVADQRAHGRSRIDPLVAEAAGLKDGARPTLGLPVEVSDGAPADHDLLRQASVLRDHLADGGRLTRAIGTPRAVKEAAALIQYVRVNGSQVDTVEEAERAVDFFSHRRTLTLIDSWAAQHELHRPAGVSHHEWLVAIAGITETGGRVLDAIRLVDQLVSFPLGPSPDAPAELIQAALATISQEVVASLDPLAEAAEGGARVRIDGMDVRSRAAGELALRSLRACDAREAHHRHLPDAWAQKCDPLESQDDPLSEMLKLAAAAAAIPGPARTSDLSPSAVNRVAERAQIDGRRNELRREHDRVIGGLRRRLASCVPMSPATAALDAALQAESANDYRIAMDELERERQMADRARLLAEARQRIEQRHPNLVAAFDLGDARAATVLGDLDAFQDLRDRRQAVERWKAEVGSSEAIHQELARLERDHRKAEREVAELRAWSSAIDRLQSRRELGSALSALTIALDKVPKTRTAKTYPARMRALRSATRDAAPAIPCWVMAIDRVAEVLGYPRGEDRFDVVIVDEASQAWFPAMFLYAIADQVIVVGDDLQTSPSQVMAVDGIQAIVDQHIPEHRLANQVGPDLSLYDVAAVMTGPDTMVDHFRCVPEIIDLSNRLSYGPKGKRLLPSRVREPGALQPVHHVQVRGQRRGSTGANDAEVQAIVEQIARCHADPAYKGLDFGVVVVGPSPAAHLKAIVTRLLEELGPAAIEERNLEVGTSSQFQGAERNVMFLSLVDVPLDGGRLRKWAHEHTGQNRKRVQQLNVAVSRARDQLWVFRSFDLSALAPDDARSVIVRSATATFPTLEDELEKCDSQFERDVVTALASADPSLTIRTQVEAIGYSLDIVLENPEGHRLAVECDGDRWHTEHDQIRSDLYRQRTLESIGWSFERFLASEWYDDPSARTRAILDRLRSISTARAAGPAPAPGSSAHESTAVAEPEAEPLGGAEGGGWTEAGEEPDPDPPLEEGDAPAERSPAHRAPETTDSEPMPDATPVEPDAGADGRPTTGPPSTAHNKETNRLLAAAIRAEGGQPNGETWIRARVMLEGGATIEEAAAASMGRSGAPPIEPLSTSPRVETLTCDRCWNKWTRPPTRGRKPRFCPECR